MYRRRFRDYYLAFLREESTVFHTDEEIALWDELNALTGDNVKAAVRFRTASVPVFLDEDIMLFDWSWRAPEPNWGEGTYVFRDGDWVRP